MIDQKDSTLNAMHVAPQFRTALAMPKEDRIRFLHEPRWIGYPLAERILGDLKDLMNRPLKPRMQNLLIVGESNNGKTTLSRRFSDLNGTATIDDASEPSIPVIEIDAPPSADEKGLYISILEKFWVPYRATDSAQKLRFQVLHQMRFCKVRMLIIDEFHSLLTGPATDQRRVMNAIKNLCNELMIPIIGVGTREAVRVLHMDPQHSSRFDVVSLPSWELNREFQNLLGSFEAILPLRNASLLHRPELATALHAISGGNLGDLHRLLIECAKEAIETETEQIDLALIQRKAWVQPTKGIRHLQR
jgi:hypothetical protein